MPGHKKVIDLVRAVKHNTKGGKCFSQILGRFGFTSTGWSSWVGSQLNVESTSNGNPASVGKWSNNESGGGSHVLVSVLESRLDLLN